VGVRRGHVKGRCLVCGKRYWFAGMSRHVLSCIGEVGDVGEDRECKSYVISVKGVGITGITYWMIVEVGAGARLSDLDKFLREKWVECCWHLSRFRICGASFYSEEITARDLDGETMDHSLREVIREGIIFHYDYDFGTTTLQLKVLACSIRAVKAIRVLAVNEEPEFICSTCNRRATLLCNLCISLKGEPLYLCDVCSPKHKIHEDYLYVLANSPRVGLCGYNPTQ